MLVLESGLWIVFGQIGIHCKTWCRTPVTQVNACGHTLVIRSDSIIDHSIRSDSMIIAADDVMLLHFIMLLVYNVDFLV